MPFEIDIEKNGSRRSVASTATDKQKLNSSRERLTETLKTGAQALKQTGEAATKTLVAYRKIEYSTSDVTKNEAQKISKKIAAELDSISNEFDKEESVEISAGRLDTTRVFALLED